MGRGKKDKPDKVTKSLSKLAISDEASTSAPQIPQPREEETKAAETDVKVQTPSEPISEAPKEETGGLGLDIPKRRRQRKKGGGATSAAAPSASTVPQTEKPEFPGLGPTPSLPTPTNLPPQPPLTSWARPSGTTSAPASAGPITSGPAAGPISSGPVSYGPRSPSGPISSGPVSSVPHGPISFGTVPSDPVPSGPISHGPRPSGPVPSGPISYGPRPSGPISSPPTSSQPQAASFWGKPSQSASALQSPSPGVPGAGFPPQSGYTQPSGRTEAAAPFQQRGAGRGAGRGQTQQSSQTPGPVAQPHDKPPPGAGDKEIVCRFRIPAKIEQPGLVMGRPITVHTNYLPMTIQPKKIHRYDVSFKPDKPKKMIPKAFTLVKQKLFPKNVVAFDQMKNCYSLTELPGVTMNDRVSDIAEFQDNNGKTMTFEVSFKHTGVVDLGTITAYMENKGTSLSPPTEAIQCIDVVLRQGTLESYIKAGRQFFKRPSNPINLGQGLEMWTGLFQSAIFTSRSFVNIDVAHKGFPKQQPLVDAICNDFRLDLNMPIDRQDRKFREREHFMSFIKGLRVVAFVGGDQSSKGQRREFICNELVAPPNKMEFTSTDREGKSVTMTVADYFTKEKKIKLQYPNLNCMWVGPRDKKIFYPIELLHVSYGQALNKQLNEFQLSTMVREAATPPDIRKRKIFEVISDMKYSQNKYFKSFGLDIKDEFYSVKAKVLQPPKLSVGGRVQIQPSKGAWQANKLLVPATLDNWGFMALELDLRGSNSDRIISSMINIGNRMGMEITEPKREHLFYNVRIQELKNKLAEALDRGVRFLIIVVSNRGKDFYHQIKQKAERHVGILTQCIKETTAQKRINDQTIRNILLKVNSKLMGVNQALDHNCLPRCLASGGCMVVGADVTHPSPDQSSVPSIAAVTASIDDYCFKYNIQLSIQTPKKEVIIEFEDMMLEHLKEYRKYQKRLPKKIFVFRDGVSEGQFAQVMNSELQAVHDAYRKLAEPHVKPEVLFLLVQKRHHTRLFVPNSNQNVEPGTVVDTDIVHAKELDFYLVSHQAIKGTARPTRYHAVCNDGGIPAQEVEQLTYYLCHLYARCMRAVSYPTPTYYAHLACLRARSLTHGEKFDNADLERRPRRLRVMEKILETSRMFFV